jgi:LytS/YehU family sensor histidine kinase
VQNEALIQHIEYYFFLYASLMAVFYMITYYEHHARSEIKQLEISRQLLQHQLDTFIQGVDGDILIRKMDDILKLLDSDNLSASNEMLNMSEYLREILILSRKGKHGIDEEIRFVKRFLHFIGISQNLSVSILFDRSKSQDNLEIKPLTIKLVLDAIFHYFKKFIPKWEKVGLSIQKESEKVTIQIQPEITQISDESESRKRLEDFFNHLKNFDSIEKTDIHLDYKTEAIIIDIPSV